jgi:hypothetical protein
MASVTRRSSWRSAALALVLAAGVLALNTECYHKVGGIEHPSSPGGGPCGIVSQDTVRASSSLSSGGGIVGEDVELTGLDIGLPLVLRGRRPVCRWWVVPFYTPRKPRLERIRLYVSSSYLPPVLYSQINQTT